MSKSKILYVEDEVFLAKIVKESLEGRGYQITMIHNGSKAIQAFEKSIPDICLLDVMLPGMDGFQLGERIREIDPKVPIIYLTAKTETEDLVKGFKSGGNDYIRKPFSLEELVVRIENLLQLKLESKAAKKEAVAVYQISSFEFEPGILEIRHNGSTTKLSHKENELLKLLVTHAQQTIDRSTILKEIWGDDHFFNSRNLDVYITKLRNRFKSDPNIQIITLKGVGYRFTH